MISKLPTLKSQLEPRPKKIAALLKGMFFLSFTEKQIIIF